MKKESYSFFSGIKAIDAIRSSGYKNAAMALGELVDNSLQANAKNVEILISSFKDRSGQRSVTATKNIAVLDDGSGMEKDVLRRALRLGDGTRFDEDGGIGKFGVGLPQASVSQCKRVDVWSWQNGFENALHTYIDLANQEWIDDFTIPEPERKDIPEKWLSVGNIFSETGTLVVWSNIDRLNWKTPTALHRNSEFFIGRMYRYWLNDNKASINMITFDEDTNEIDDDRVWEFKAVDPLYLMEDTSVKDVDPPCNPLFKQYGKPIEKKFKIRTEDGFKEGRIKLTFSIAKKKAREYSETGNEAGNLPHGKHAKKNIGLSIVREDRELELDSRWIPIEASKPMHRWWGAEIKFGREFDDIFGVTNNKQHAHNLSEMISKDHDYFKKEGESFKETEERLKRDDPKNYVNLVVSKYLRKHIKQVYKKVKNTSPKRPKDEDTGGKRHDITSVKSTNATKNRKETKGKTGESDKYDNLGLDELKELREEELKKRGYDKLEIEEILERTIDEERGVPLKYDVIRKRIDTNAFFSVESEADLLIIALNTEHDTYDKLFGILDEIENSDEDEYDLAELRNKVEKANDSIKILLEAWARMEDEAPLTQKSKFKEARRLWGQIAKEFSSFGEE